LKLHKIIKKGTLEKENRDESGVRTNVCTKKASIISKKKGGKRGRAEKNSSADKQFC